MPSVTYLFNLLMIFFEEQNFLVLMDKFINLFFASYTFGIVSNKSLPNSRWGHKGFFRCFFPRGYILLSFIFRFMIHFELIFVYGAKLYIHVYLFAYRYPNFPVLLRRLFFLHWIICVPCQRVTIHICVDCLTIFCSLDLFAIISHWSLAMRTPFILQLVLEKEYWRRKPTLVFCLKNPMDRVSLAGYSPMGHKELDTIEWVSTHINITLAYLL